MTQLQQLSQDERRTASMFKKTIMDLRDKAELPLELPIHAYALLCRIAETNQELSILEYVYHPKR
jgi:hypothetical protein